MIDAYSWRTSNGRKLQALCGCRYIGERNRLSEKALHMV